MPEPAAVPGRTELKTVHPDIYASPVYLAGLLERVRRTKDVESLFAAEIEEMQRRTPAASPVAGVSAENEGPFLIYFEDADMANSPEVFVGEGAEETALYRFKQLNDRWTCHLMGPYKLAQPSAEGDGWIAVTDDMPKFGEDVLTYTPPQPKWGHSAKRRVSRIIMYSGKKEMAWFDGDINQFITHWRPLPAPPVAKEGRES